MNYTAHLTYEERERRAYAMGHTAGAAILGELADSAAGLEGADAAETHINEAKGSYPDEDAMQDQINDLRTIAKRLRGENRQELEAVAQALEDARDSQARESEYGLEALGHALKALGA